MPTARTSASTARTTSRRPAGSGRSTSSARATSAIRRSRPATRGSACTSATTVTSRRARAHSVANGYFVGAINRVGTEAPWNIGMFYGNSYFCDPRGQILACASEDKYELVTATLEMDMIEEVRRTWQFFRDRRPDSYGILTEDR